MNDSVKTYAARIYSTGIYGRAICNSRHLFSMVEVVSYTRLDLEVTSTGRFLVSI